ncbi:hypothetical protein GCM10008013_15870 [Paenibacillus segetis]|uniref:Uncharacterized protein n=1 Tax=Paenibacillus segetis TaxID=1325360 RepID=A0ABQ1YCI9_9BACL|nr:hypothetical protein GCM10008013_15870 [Paenibacillus segetis]
MFEDLNARLIELKELGRKKEKLEARLIQLQKELAELESTRDMWQQRLVLEEKDVDKLTGMSLTYFFYTILGKKDEKLDQEQREVFEAKLKYDEAERAVIDTLEQINHLEQQLKDVRFWKMDYDQIFRTKEEQLLRDNAELRELTERRAELKVQYKELNEAVQAGQSVIYDLGRAEDELRSAKNWGTYDMLGGGMISTHIKHSRVDEAMEHIYIAQNSLRRFQKELGDVGEHLPEDLEISGALKFGDYFFDGFITDWLVQGRINDTLEQVREKQSKINRMQSGLESAKRKVESELATIERKYIQTVELYK